MSRSERRGRRAAFVDTFCIVAILDQKDGYHDRAMDLAARLAAENAQLVTTDAVLIEVANYFAEGALRSFAIDWIATLRGTPAWDVIPLERSLLARGEARYRRYHDKEWSLTDCISMEVMKERGIPEVATADHHFRQAGFHVLLA